MNIALDFSAKLQSRCASRYRIFVEGVVQTKLPDGVFYLLPKLKTNETNRDRAVLEAPKIRAARELAT